MNEIVKNARMTRKEVALALGLDLEKPEDVKKWKTLMWKAHKYGIGEVYGKGKRIRYSYENLKRLKQLLVMDNRKPPVRTELVALVKKQLQDDGY